MKPNPIWRLPAVGSVRLSNTGGKRETLFAEGYRRMEVLVAEGNVIHSANIAELQSIGPSMIAAGWTICSWHSTTGAPTPKEEAETALAAIAQVSQLISGHNLNAEVWYEGSARWKTAAYWDEFQAHSNLPVAVWPMGSDTGSSRRDFDYQTCVARGCMIYPQQYQNVNPSYSIAAGEANLAFTGIPIENRGTSPGTYINSEAPFIPWDAYAWDLARTPRPVLLYYGDAGGFDPVAAGRLIAHIPDPEPEPDDMAKIGFQDGIDAWFEWLQKNAEWQVKFTTWLNGPRTTKPPIPPKVPTRGPNYDPDDLSTWPWPDKLKRTLNILKEDHDA